MEEYVIVGDMEKYKESLIYVCGTSFEHAQNVLNRILNNPTVSEKREIEKYTNIKIKEVDSKDCWWNYGCD